MIDLDRIEEYCAKASDAVTDLYGAAKSAGYFEDGEFQQEHEDKATVAGNAIMDALNASSEVVKELREARGLLDDILEEVLDGSGGWHLSEATFDKLCSFMGVES